MLNGNGKAAMRYVVNQSKGGILKLSEETKQQLADKHPEGRDAADETLIKGPVPENVDPIVFSALDANLIKKWALKTEGAAGVSQANDPALAQDGYKLQRLIIRVLCSGRREPGALHMNLWIQKPMRPL